MPQQKAYDPSKVTKYATELATLFHKFYDVCSIKYAETPELKQARLLLAEAARQGIENALRHSENHLSGEDVIAGKYRNHYKQVTAKIRSFLLNLCKNTRKAT